MSRHRPEATFTTWAYVPSGARYDGAVGVRVGAGDGRAVCDADRLGAADGDVADAEGERVGEE
ncbi:hypothetical protein, partial [Streptomyces vinaceusdrappus]|uniref:hypothetical protein n=1 Tax=Streptomyces vinaceusdrappus TaxID=67376 RepID=UPI0037049596